MTARAVSIGRDSIRPSDFPRTLRLPANPLFSFKELSIRNRALIVLFLIAAITGVMFVISQAFGAGVQKDNMNTSNTNNTSPSSNQQPPKEDSGQPSISSRTNMGTGSNTTSTSITVNGQSVDIPQSGAYDKNVNVSGANVHVSGNTSQSTTGGSATNNSSTNVEINSE